MLQLKEVLNLIIEHKTFAIDPENKNVFVRPGY